MYRNGRPPLYPLFADKLGCVSQSDRHNPPQSPPIFLLIFRQAMDSSDEVFDYNELDDYMFKGFIDSLNSDIDGTKVLT